MWRRGNFRAHFGQRLGLYSRAERAELAAHRWTWLQSISVGETLVALKLARELRAQDPGLHLLLSTTTTTGFALAQEHASDWLRPIYNPLDLRPIVRRVLSGVMLHRLVVMEGGIWPNLAAECAARGIPLFLVAARLSPRSEARFRRFRVWTGPLFRLFCLIGVPEESDCARWLSLGAPAARIQVTGSIKFDQPAVAPSGRAEEFRRLVAALGVPIDAPIIVAGSTFPGEETLLARALLELRPQFPTLFLILVPRHVERTPAILAELSPLPLRARRRSQLPEPTDNPVQKRGDIPPMAAPDILLVDTTGELRDWYALATVAFLGKSLTATGGQNPAEATVLSKPVIFGPHMENFAALAAHLLASGAALQLASAEELAPTLHRLLSDPTLQARLAAAAGSALTSHRGATAQTARLILDTASPLNDGGKSTCQPTSPPA